MKVLFAFAAAAIVLVPAAPANAGLFSASNDRVVRATAKWASAKFDVEITSDHVTIVNRKKPGIAVFLDKSERWVADIIVKDEPSPRRFSCSGNQFFDDTECIEEPNVGSLTSLPTTAAPPVSVK